MGKLVVIKGDTFDGVSRVRVWGGVFPGVQTKTFLDDQDATNWAVEMYGYYSRQGSRVNFSYT